MDIPCAIGVTILSLGVIYLIIGLIKPKWVLPFIKKKTRIKVILVFLCFSVVSAIFFYNKTGGGISYMDFADGMYADHEVLCSN